MKNLVLTIVSVFTVITIKAQSNDIAYFSKPNESITSINQIDNVIPNLVSNLSYLNKVSVLEYSKNVRNIEMKIANFDLKSNAIYDDSEKATYQVTFKRRNSRAYVVYNNEGTIISTNEKYIDINIPLALRIKILKENPGFGIFGNTVLVSYSYSIGIDAIYKIEIRKGNDRRILKFDRDFMSI